jgi:DNA-binding transcriptional regulator LsrR (DeoR family)
VFKAKALKAGLAGRLLTGLITNEITAELLL